jgi:hypothetical protein
MPKTLRTQVIRGLIVLILVIGTLSFLKISNFFAPTVTTVEQGPTRLGEPVVDPLSTRDDEKVITRRFSEDADKSPPSESRSMVNPLRSSLPASTASPAPYPTSYDTLQDLTLGEEILFPSWEEQAAQAQYLHDVAAMEELLQQEFDPTAATPNLTVEQVAAIEEEIRESILQEEALQPLLEDLQPDGYGIENSGSPAQYSPR